VRDQGSRLDEDEDGHAKERKRRKAGTETREGGREGGKKRWINKQHTYLEAHPFLHLVLPLPLPLFLPGASKSCVALYGRNFYPSARNDNLGREGGREGGK